MWQLLRICLPVKKADRTMPMEKEKNIRTLFKMFSV